MNSRTISTWVSDFLFLMLMTTATQALWDMDFFASTNITDLLNPLLSFYSGETKAQKREMICPDHGK